MSRILPLDGLRGAAISLVIVWHYFSCQLVAESGIVLHKVARLLTLTWSGVDLFFVLSGFLIAGILIDQRGANNYFRLFYLRRTLRIFPLYFLVLGTFLLLLFCGATDSARFQWLFARPLPLWSYALFVQNIFMALRSNFGANWLSITWSLAVEEQFYLLLPLLIFLVPRRGLIAAFGVLILSAPLLRWYWPGFHTFVLLPYRADSLLAGAAIAFLVRSPRFMLVVKSHRGVLIGFAGLCGAALMIVSSDPLQSFNHFWLAGLYASLVLMVVLENDSALGRALQWRPLMWLGTRSYGIFMFHQIVSGLMHGWIHGQPPRLVYWSDAGITILALAITLVAAALSFRFLEGPLLKYGHGFKYRTIPSHLQTIAA